MQHLQNLTILNSAYYLDGGTAILYCVDQDDQRHNIRLSQRRFHSAHSGRLYFDEQLVPVRSPLETELLALLERAAIRYEPAPMPGRPIDPPSKNSLILSEDIKDVMERDEAANLRAFQSGIVNYVRSDEYVRYIEEHAE
ncbi:hypothetical protein [Blastopirellula marina]|uniref:Uncharacterized protein n=1 Tax=Blastopirellula marina TaxID=124 RepID=A0A2S8GIG9_9BACT|nr:hypothetical protein [Blastopirellula marina]PQO44238.1 hypothetical protein C5Y93_19950 [Blastopirellula marina]